MTSGRAARAAGVVVCAAYVSGKTASFTVQVTSTHSTTPRVGSLVPLEVIDNGESGLNDSISWMGYTLGPLTAGNIQVHSNSNEPAPQQRLPASAAGALVVFRSATNDRELASATALRPRLLLLATPSIQARKVIDQRPSAHSAGGVSR